MKKTISSIILIFILLLSLFLIILSSKGIETKKFNDLVTSKINQKNNNVILKLNSIKFKLDISEISLFIETSKPEVNYRNVAIPVENIKVYIDFISLLKTQPEVKKIKLSLEELDINQLKILTSTIKPSNLKSFINNKIKKGKIFSELEFYLNENYSVDNFIAKGKVSNLSSTIISELTLEKTNFDFFADQTDILVTNIFGELDSIKIKDGDIQFKLSPEISLKSNFLSEINYNNKSFIKFSNLFKNIEYAEDVIDLEANLSNNLSVNFDKTYKIKNYNFNNNGKISKANFKFKKNISNNFLKKNINELSFVGSQIRTNFNLKKNNIYLYGKYSLNNEDYLTYDLKHNTNEKMLNVELDIQYNEDINLNLINYKKPKGSIANFYVDLEKDKNKIKIKKIDLKENNNYISAEGLELKKGKLLSFKKILVDTKINKKINNDFSILYGKKIKIKGSQFDASNLPKILTSNEKRNYFSKINKEIEINLSSIIAPLSENLKNFKLIGFIEKGKFVKISSKGDFENNKFLDISMKNDSKNKKKFLEIYSDLPKPFLTEYKFFNGLTGGKLLYSSIIDNDGSKSKLLIEDFKLVNAPGVVQLLSLADLGGLADLAEGEGLSFNTLEITLSKNKGYTKLNEILALGPSISVLMDGYQDQNGLTSLRGTLVPAKNLNKLISKIPVIGDIVIPKEVGEGLFGISFKMKGPPGEIKTTINPIRTITPRFIQKIIDRNKLSK
jgi:hypothetical protein